MYYFYMTKKCLKKYHWLKMKGLYVPVPLSQFLHGYSPFSKARLTSHLCHVYVSHDQKFMFHLVWRDGSEFLYQSVVE